jgi:hypothetical protein
MNGKRKTRRRPVATLKALPAPKSDKAAFELEPKTKTESEKTRQLATMVDGKLEFTREGFRAITNAFRSGEGTHGIDDKTIALLCQATRAFPSARDGSESYVQSVTIQLMESLGPRDGLETLISVQLLAMHHLAMDFARRASQRDQTVEGLDANVNRATRCTRAFVALTEALDAHRSGRKQKMTVKHIHVYTDQAIVGDVTHTGGSGE